MLLYFSFSGILWIQSYVCQEKYVCWSWIEAPQILAITAYKDAYFLAVEMNYVDWLSIEYGFVGC